MSVKIRMKRLGAKKSPYYRIVVADSRRARNGRFIEELGYYNPLSNPRMFSVNADRVKDWIQVGATPSDTVARLFKEYSVLESTGVIAVGPDAENVKKALVQEEQEKAEAAEREAANEAERVEKEAEKTEEAEETAEAAAPEDEAAPAGETVED
jgi:small subunit ribosomal protein S16